MKARKRGYVSEWMGLSGSDSTGWQLYGSGLHYLKRLLHTFLDSRTGGLDFDFSGTTKKKALYSILIKRKKAGEVTLNRPFLRTTTYFFFFRIGFLAAGAFAFMAASRPPISVKASAALKG